MPKPRASSPLTDVELLDLAVRLKREHPRRAATHICELIATELAARGDGRRVPSPRTVQRHFARLGLGRHPGPAPKAFVRFEAEQPRVEVASVGALTARSVRVCSRMTLRDTRVAVA